MADRKGLAPLPVGLLRPSTPVPAPTLPEPEPELDQVEASEPEIVAETPAVDRTGSATKPRRPRRRVDPAETGKGRKLHLPDSLHDRLWLQARAKKTTVSAIAAEILDRNLPHFRVEREG